MSEPATLTWLVTRATSVHMHKFFVFKLYKYGEENNTHEVYVYLLA